MEEEELVGSIPLGVLRGGLQLHDIDALLRAHGASIRSVDNHHWQISRGNRSAIWLLGDGAAPAEGGLDPASLERLQGVLRLTGLLKDQDHTAPFRAPMGAAILWVGREATRVYWINEQGLACEGARSISHWLHGEITVHRERQTPIYLRRIVAMLERIERALLIGRRSHQEKADGASSPEAELPLAWEEDREAIEAGERGGLGFEAAPPGDLERLTRLLERERPDLRRRVVGVLSLETDRLDDALLFSMARHYLHPQPISGMR